MFPAQTSFIPITVALARFIEVNGFSGDYPFWYLGTTPVKYLTGPVVPGLLVGLHEVLPQFSLFNLSIFLVFVTFLINSAGWGLLAAALSGRKGVGVMVGFGVLVLPWHVFSALGMGEVSAVMASAITPWVLLAFVWGPARSNQLSVFSSHPSTALRMTLSRPKGQLSEIGWSGSRAISLKSEKPKTGKLQSENRKRRTDNSYSATPLNFLSIVSFKEGSSSGGNGQWLASLRWRSGSMVFPAVAFAVLLLTNTTASVPTIVGILILSVVGNKHWQEALKRVGIVLFLGGLLTLWWYSPGYWLTVWGAPGIGGKSAIWALATFVNFLRGFLPVVAAVLIVFWQVKPKTIFEKFTLGWIVLFGSLTLFRFMADPDFWMDWTSWIPEVEIGLALMFGHAISRGPASSSSHPTSSSIKNRLRALDGTPSAAVTPRLGYVLLITCYIIFGWFLAWQNRSFWLPRRSIETTVEYRIAKWLEIRIRGSTPEGEDKALGVEPLQVPTVFLSGSTAFWLNSLVDVKQVRGGRDEGSVNSRWREVSWEAREGDSENRSVEALRGLGVDFLVVHTDESSEYYHDFKYPRKFEDSRYFEQVYKDYGDIIYRIK